MRVGVVTTSYPRWPGDAAGSFVAAHVDAMRALGHDVDVVGAHEIASSLFDGHGAPEQLERGRGYVRGAWFTARLAAEILRRAHAWDLIVAHWLVPAVAALPAQKPVLAIAHGGDVHLLRRLRLLAPTLKLLRARGARLVFVSDQLRALAGVPDGPDVIVQPMGVDLPHFAALRRTPTTPPTLLVVARLVPVKGVDVALAALDHVRSPVQLVIAGDGPERARLERHAIERGMMTAMRANLVAPPARAARHRVTFLGAVDARTRDQLLCEASAVLVPSRVLPNGRSEGTPLIALEALAAGVPVIASAVGGLAALAGTTRVRPEDPRALAAAIERVLAAPPPAHDLRASISHLAWPEVARRLFAHAGCEAGDSNRRRSA